MTTVTKVTNPYTPGSGIRPPFFADRNKEIEIFERKIERANQGIISHIAVLGDWGIGKTVLLDKFRRIAMDNGCRIIPMNLYSSIKPESFVKLFVNASSFILKPPKWKKFVENLSQLGVSVMGFGVDVGKEKGITEPQTSLIHVLRQVWKESEGDTVIVIIDDIQQISEAQQTLEILRNAFSFVNNEGARFMLVVSGTPDLFDKFWQTHAPLTRFFEPRILEPLDEMGVRDAILKPVEDRDAEFDEKVIERITEVSDGVPFYIQLICYYCLEESNRIDPGVYEAALPKAISDISARYFDNMYFSQSANARKTLHVIYSEEKPLKFTDIVERVKKLGVKDSTARKAIVDLTNSGCLKRINTGEFEGHYTLRDKFFNEYLRIRYPFMFNGIK